MKKKTDKPIISNWTKIKESSVTLSDFGKRKVYVLGSTAHFAVKEQYEKLKLEAQLNDCEIIEYKDHLLIVLNEQNN